MVSGILFAASASEKKTWGFSRPGIIQGQCLRRKKERCRKSAFLSVAGTFYCGGGGGNSNMFLMFIPKIGEMIQFFEHIFSNGLVQPPTRMVFSWVVMWKTERLCDSQLDFTLPPEIEGIDTFWMWPYLEGYRTTFSKAHRFGYPAISFSVVLRYITNLQNINVN